jgi:hypothetical protein
MLPTDSMSLRRVVAAEVQFGTLRVIAQSFQKLMVLECMPEAFESLLIHSPAGRFVPLLAIVRRHAEAQNGTRGLDADHWGQLADGSHQSSSRSGVQIGRPNKAATFL